MAENKDPKEVEEGKVPTLDEVNDLTQAKLEHEDDPSDNDETPEPKGGDKPDVDEAPKPKDDEPVPDKVEPEAVVPDKPEPDTEITKSGKDKVAIKSFDGKTYYFNNLDEVPDDFEPASYKQLMLGVDKLRDKAQSDKQAEAEAEQKAQDAEVKQRTDAMQASWDKDIKTLKLDEKQVDAVYDYISNQLKENVVLDNFSNAYKAMKYDESLEQEQDDEKAVNDLKKKRGGKVQGGGSTGSNKPVMREGPPQGLSLDAVHSKVLNEL